jgi:signal transduction histidine kinase
MSTEIPGQLLSVIEGELNRIVLDVHDGTVQNLFVALSLLGQIQHELKAEPQSLPDVQQKVAQVTEMVQASLHEIKFFLGTFRSPGFKDSPLEKLVQALVFQHENWTGQVVELELGPLPAQVPLVIKIALYRLLQEALSNSYRHAGTDYQSVKLWQEGEELCLQVEDEGRGFEPPSAEQLAAEDYEAHIGLKGMQERVRVVGGSFHLQSQPGQGTKISVRVALK